MWSSLLLLGFNRDQVLFFLWWVFFELCDQALMIKMWWVWAGFGLTTPEFTATAVVDRLKSADVYVTGFLSPKCQVGVHFNLLHNKGLKAAKVVGSYVWDEHTIVKGRFDDNGIVAGLLEYSPYPLITFNLPAEFNSLNLRATPNVGLSFSMLGGAANWTHTQQIGPGGGKELFCL